MFTYAFTRMAQRQQRERPPCKHRCVYLRLLVISRPWLRDWLSHQRREDAGSNPQWGTDQTPGEAISLTLAGPPPSLGIEVWEEDALKSDMIGCHVLDVGTQIGPAKGGNAWSWAGWSELTNYKEGKVTGEVRVPSPGNRCVLRILEFAPVLGICMACRLPGVAKQCDHIF